jgi:exopolysaccharide biosynthesis polyprenyl glycosylphosphotransferase
MKLNFIRYQERWILLVTDFVAFNLAYYFTYLFRFHSGWFENPFAPVSVVIPALATSIFWMLLFALQGGYRPLYGQSRLDSLINVMKTTLLGLLIIYVILTLDREPPISRGKVTFLVYWGFLVVFAGGGRIILRTIQHQLLLAGVALSPTLIVGFNERGRGLLNQTLRFPVMGYQVVGFIDDVQAGGEYRGFKVLGTIEDLPHSIANLGIKEVILALGREEGMRTERAIGLCGQTGVGIKILPDLHHILSGQVKSHVIYGMPLIEVFPDLMPPWERGVKRFMDIVLSILSLICTTIPMLIIGTAIKLDTAGPVIYSQKRVGRKGSEFTLYKFRSMVKDAEAQTGAVWAEKDDPRITRVGHYIRKTRLDELPQLFNVLKGDMSFVGPRPERKKFVEQFIHQIPLYSRRLNVKPGLTGWAQIKYKYDESIEDVKVKLSYDIFYLDNISLRFDLKILLQTVAVMLRGKGQ